MYEEYFGLQRPPFKITPDTSLFYDGGRRGDILDALVYAIHRGEGIVKVVGEVGSGKTMLCRMLQLKLPKTIEIVYIANPSVSAQDILFVIAHELSLPVDKGASKHEVMHMLQDYLLQRHMENKQVVLFVEEAQGMPLDTLEEIRLLSNLETDQNKLLQIVLFGQPELDQNLSKQSIRQLRERITHNFNLGPLSDEEIHTYLNFRMREVGYTGPELINKSVAKKVEQHSGGLLRRINIIADKILLSAFAEGTHNLSAKHVTAAVNDSSFGEESVSRSNKWLWLGILVIIALSVALFYMRSQWSTMLASEKVENAAIIDKQVTDIRVNALETEAEVRTLEVEPVTPVATIEESPAVETEVMPEALEQVLQASVKQEEDEVLQKAQSQAEASEPLAVETSADISLTADYNQWLNAKLQESRQWLQQAGEDNVSIQVLTQKKAAAKDLVYYLRNNWPLELSKTYLYEVSTSEASIYRVFYSEFKSLSEGRDEIERLPRSVRINSPYLHSIHRMQKALL